MPGGYGVNNESKCGAGLKCGSPVGADDTGLVLGVNKNLMVWLRPECEHVKLLLWSGFNVYIGFLTAD